MEIGSMIQFYRTKQGLTQKDLANGICSVSYLSKIESGAIEPKTDTIELIFSRLNIDYEKITSYDEPTIHQRIDQLYKKVNHHQLDEAKLILQELENIITPFHQPYTQNYFLLIHYYYLITIDPTERNKIDIENLLTMEDQFEGQHLYYFYKIVGFYYNSHLNSKKANYYFHKAKENLESLNLKDPQIYYFLAVSYMGMQMPVYSNYYVGIALGQYARDLLYRKVTDCYHLLGINYLQLGAYDLAENYLNQVLQSKPMGDAPAVKSRVSHNLGSLYFRKKDYETSLKYLHEALDNHKSLYDILYSLYVIAKIHFITGEKNLALEYIQKGESQLRGGDLTKVRYRFYVLKNQVNETTTDQEFIERAENVILPYYQKIGENGLIREILEVLAEAHMQKEEYSLAAKYYKQLADRKF